MKDMFISQDSSIGIIGGADGPTAIFLAGELDNSWNWINVFGMIVVILILVPNIIYAVKYRNVENRCRSKIMNLLEQIGRYACMLFMVLHIGGGEGFASVTAFLLYLFGNAVLLLGYWIVWLLYFIKQTAWKSVTLAVLPVLIFLLSGATLNNIPLIVSTAIFGVAHIYVTWQNVKK